MKFRNITVSLVLISVGFFVGTVFAQSWNHSAEKIHGSHSSGSMPVENGQAAFAAIAEIVRLLENDANTDWQKVNIKALRNHLVDMNALTLSAKVEVVSEEQSIRFVATGMGETVRALQSMVPAHARELDKMAQWSASGRVLKDGAVLTISPVDDRARSKILGLGFFGLMATGAHHQVHHLAIASGNPMH